MAIQLISDIVATVSAPADTDLMLIENASAHKKMTYLDLKNDMAAAVAITPAGEANEVQINVTGNFTASQFFANPSNGYITLGSPTLAGANRNIEMEGSAADVHLYIRSKGAGAIGLYSGVSALFVQKTTGVMTLSPGANDGNDFVLNGSGATGANAGKNLVLTGGNTTDGTAGNTVLKGGIASNSGIDGIVTIETAGAERLRVDIDGKLGIGSTATPDNRVHITESTLDTDALKITINSVLKGNSTRGILLEGLNQTANGAAGFRWVMRDDGNVNRTGGAITLEKTQLWVNGNSATYTSNLVFTIRGPGGEAEIMRLLSNGGVNMNALPTSNPGGSGNLWNNGGVINIT